MTAANEIKSIIESWNYENKQLLQLRSEIVDCAKTCFFVYLVNEIIVNEGDAYQYFMNLCDNDEDNLYDCDELDDMVIDAIDELLK